MARLLLRNEGMASSGIEGLREPIESVLVAARTGGGGNAGWMADNLVVIDSALDTAHEPLTVDILHSWHRQLMRNGMLPSNMVGSFRPALGWVGGTSPSNAAYVPPPPSEIPRLTDDLVAFANSEPEDLDPVSHAAIIHAQFVAVHPYGDGNGRLGRVLISRTLRRSGVSPRTTVPISIAIARDPGGYLSGLHLFEQGTVDPWISWFSETAVKAALATDQIYDQMQALIARWEESTVGLRADHSARALLAHLPALPVLNAGDVADLLGVSERSGRTALTALASCGVVSRVQVESNGSGRDRHWFAAPELLKLWSP
ncbi:MAG: Fic family protein [Acidimicrobiaceae bacterium]|nr:Fic family protein [Acidimicrobiaceae bacterium]